MARKSRARAAGAAKKTRKTTKKAAARPRVAATIKVQIWLDPRDGRIRIVAPGHFISTVSDQPGARLHRHLYGKLKSLLKKRGKWFEAVPD